MWRLLGLVLMVCSSPVALRAAGEEPEPEPITLSVGDVDAEPGELVEVPIAIESADPLSLVAFTIEYDATAFEFVSVSLQQSIEQLLDSEHSAYRVHVDLLEGYVQLAVATDFLGRKEKSIPPGLLRQLATLTFRASDDAPLGEYAVSLTDPATASFEGSFSDGTDPVFNAVHRFGSDIDQANLFEGVETPELLDGSIGLNVIGDIGIFVRGDANRDFQVDLSDSQTILGYLFQGGLTPPCLPACDANDDGSVDISDPILILDYLFLGSSNWSPMSVDLEGPDVESGCAPPRPSSN